MQAPAFILMCIYFNFNGLIFLHTPFRGRGKNAEKSILMNIYKIHSEV